MGFDPDVWGEFATERIHRFGIDHANIVSIGVSIGAVTG